MRWERKSYTHQVQRHSAAATNDDLRSPSVPGRWTRIRQSTRHAACYVYYRPLHGPKQPVCQPPLLARGKSLPEWTLSQARVTGAMPSLLPIVSSAHHLPLSDLVSCSS
ncbi:hypothetical protein M8818_006417 [Zalaria obscura]|uniref:Uncharacterized protein n=1 Tax=Zalaria obscura TaxID=2024903 RepID=A0ACC3S5P7_9PEZI